MKRIKYWLAGWLLAAVLTAFGAPDLKILRRADHGLLGELPGGKRVLFVAGSPAEMGEAQGSLLAPEIHGMYQRILLTAAGYLYFKDDWFFDRIAEVESRTAPFLPERFMTECDAMSRAAGIRPEAGRQINLFPEMFHCSGIAVRGKASAGGRVRQARVLDYMRDIGLQDFAVLTVCLPEGRWAWCNVGYAGFIGTVTAMNASGLAIGELGGRGEGDWDGLPMNFLMRRIMEECGTVEEALKLMKEVPHTCEYYYVLSDRTGDLAGVAAKAGEEPQILRPGEAHPLLPEAFEDVVYLSGGERFGHLRDRIKVNYGKIDTPALIEMIKRPVAMKSNLQNAIFEPETLDLSWADAGPSSLACDEPYSRINLAELVEWYRQLPAGNPE